MEQNKKQSWRLSWWFSQTGIFVAVLLVGPLALPMIWISACFSLKKKIIFSASLVILTWLLVILMKPIFQIYQQLFDDLKSIYSL